MLFSMLVPLSRLISLLTCNVTAMRIGLVCLVIFFAVILHSLPIQIKHDSANAQSSSLRRAQGPSSQNPPILVKEVDAK